MSKVVLITGGSSGIGRAIGTYLNERGFAVYGTSRSPDKHADNSPFPLVAMEVTDPSSVTAAVTNIISKENRIDIVINNAGVGITGPIEETPVEEIDKALNINFVGALNVIMAVLPSMRARQSGLIINITSIAGYMGLPYRGIYSASKGALEITTEALRMETRSFGVKITNLAPGDFATNIAAGRYHAPITDDSPYARDYKRTLEMMNEHVDKGQDPVNVARAIHAIIRKKNPRIHYKVGAPLQKFSVFLKRILPDKLYERMLLNHYRLK